MLEAHVANGGCEVETREQIWLAADGDGANVQSSDARPAPGKGTSRSLRCSSLADSARSGACQTLCRRLCG